MNDAQLAVYQSLSRALGGKVIDPKYSPAHRQEQQESYLKQWVRKNWADRRNFPVWVNEWVERWKSEAQGEAGKDVGRDGGRDTEAYWDVRDAGVSGSGHGGWTEPA